MFSVSVFCLVWNILNSTWNQSSLVLILFKLFCGRIFVFSARLLFKFGQFILCLRSLVLWMFLLLHLWIVKIADSFQSVICMSLSFVRLIAKLPCIFVQIKSDLGNWFSGEQGTFCIWWKTSDFSPGKIQFNKTLLNPYSCRFECGVWRISVNCTGW